jgi:hypothetical protein
LIQEDEWGKKYKNIERGRRKMCGLLSSAIISEHQNP